MKCVCIRACQVRKTPNSRAIYYYPGDVDEFDNCPQWFSAIGSHQIDFLTASEAELLATKWRPTDAIQIIKDAYGINLKFSADMSKAEMVRRILDARLQAADLKVQIVDPADPNKTVPESKSDLESESDSNS